MWKNMIHMLLIIGGISIFCTFAMSQTKSADKASLAISQDPFERYDSFQKTRTDEIDYLTSVIDNSANAEYSDAEILKLAASTHMSFPLYDEYGGAKYMAIMTLGNFRAREAIEILSKNFLFIPQFTPSDNIRSRQAYYPCAVALVEIGTPAIPQMIQKIKLSSSLEERQLATWVIMSIEGKEQVIYRLNLLSKNENGDYLDRLKQAIEYARSFQPSSVPPGSHATSMKDYITSDSTPSANMGAK